jgi:hypothetical protein
MSCYCVHLDVSRTSILLKPSDNPDQESLRLAFFPINSRKWECWEGRTVIDKYPVRFTPERSSILRRRGAATTNLRGYLESRCQADIVFCALFLKLCLSDYDIRCSRIEIQHLKSARIQIWKALGLYTDGLIQKNSILQRPVCTFLHVSCCTPLQRKPQIFTQNGATTQRSAFAV